MRQRRDSAPDRTPRALFWAGVFCVTGALACSVLVATGRGLGVDRWRVFVYILVWIAAAVGAAAALGRYGRPLGSRVIVLLALSLQIVGLVGGPKLSDDLYRYIWDGHVQASGINPYEYPPTARELVPLRTTYLWPGEDGCRTQNARSAGPLHIDPFVHPTSNPNCTLINRPNVRTIYPPVAQSAFVVSAEVLPGLHDLSIEIPAAGTSLALTCLLCWALRKDGRRQEWALLYALSPLAALEAAMDGHIDVLAALLATAAIVVAATKQGRRAAVAVGLLVAAATLTKLYPALVGIAILARVRMLSRRAALIIAVAAAGVVVAYAPYVITAGVHVLGYLPGYLKENGYNTGTRFELLDAVGLGAHGTVITVVLLAMVAVLALFRRVEPGLQPLAARATAVTGVAILLTSPGNAWYCSMLIALAVLAARPEWMAVVVANYVVYFDALLHAGQHWSRVAYVSAALLIAVLAIGRAYGGRTRALAASAIR